MLHDRLASPFRRRALTGAVAALSLGFAGAALAQGEFPNKTVNLYTAFPAGSGPDAVLRQLADKLSKLWGQPVIVNNRPGGGGFIAFDAVKRAPADGYTLLQLDSEHLSAVPHLYKNRGFDTLKTFDPVASLYQTPFLVTVPADSKWKSMADLIAAAKANPGKLSYGSWGVGSPGHLGGEQLELLTGTEMQHVAFKEMAQLFTSVANHDVAWSFGSVPSSQGVYKAGKIRYLATATAKRLPQFPDVPTIGESGGPAGLEVNSFVVLVAPKGLPEALRHKINQDVARVNADPDVKARYDTFAFQPLNWSPAEIVRQAGLKSKTYGQLVQRKNISLE